MHSASRIIAVLLLPMPRPMPNVYADAHADAYVYANAYDPSPLTRQFFFVNSAGLATPLARQAAKLARRRGVAKQDELTCNVTERVREGLPALPMPTRMLYANAVPMPMPLPNACVDAHPMPMHMPQCHILIN